MPLFNSRNLCLFLYLLGLGPHLRFEVGNKWERIIYCSAQGLKVSGLKSKTKALDHSRTLNSLWIHPPTENFLQGSRLLLRPLSLSVSVSQSQPLSFSVSQSLSLSVFRDLNFNPKLNTSKLSLVKFVSRTDHHLGNIDGHVNLG